MEFSFLVYTISKKALTLFANTVVRWDQLCAAILRRNGRVEFSFLVYTISTISKKALTLFANTVVRWDQLCAAILRRNGRVEFSFLVYTISKKALTFLLILWSGGISYVRPFFGGMAAWSSVSWSTPLAKKL